MRGLVNFIYPDEDNNIPNIYAMTRRLHKWIQYEHPEPLDERQSWSEMYPFEHYLLSEETRIELGIGLWYCGGQFYSSTNSNKHGNHVFDLVVVAQESELKFLFVPPRM